MKMKLQNYKKKLSSYKTYVTIAEITQLVLSSIATTVTTKSSAKNGIGIFYSKPAAVATVTVFGSLSKTLHTKIRNKIIKYSQMYILAK